MKDVRFNSVVMQFYCEIPHGCLNLGLVTLKNEGRSYVLDTVESQWYNEGNGTKVIIRLERDDELVPECKFDLTKFDLVSSTLEATLWHEEAIEVSDGEYVEPESQSFSVTFLKQDGSQGMTKAIDLITE
jgi:hypothetical protein